MTVARHPVELVIGVDGRIGVEGRLPPYLCQAWVPFGDADRAWRALDSAGYVFMKLDVREQQPAPPHVPAQLRSHVLFGITAAGGPAQRMRCRRAISRLLGVPVELVRCFDLGAQS